MVDKQIVSVFDTEGEFSATASFMTPYTAPESCSTVAEISEIEGFNVSISVNGVDIKSNKATLKPGDVAVPIITKKEV